MLIYLILYVQECLKKIQRVSSGGRRYKRKMGQGKGTCMDRGESRKSVRTVVGSGLEREQGGRAIFVQFCVNTHETYQLLCYRKQIIPI